MNNSTNNNDLVEFDVIFTVCSVNYLSKAVALMLSAIDHLQTSKYVIIIADSKRYINIESKKIEIIWAEDLAFPNYLGCAFRYNIIEFNTLIKPFATLYLLKNYNNIIYLDPDVCIFSRLLSVQHALYNSSMVFTPHALKSYNGIGRPNDLDLLRFGSLNLGFFAIQKTTSSIEMLNWWHDKLYDSCFYEPHIGLGVDQKWMDLVTSFYNDVFLIRDFGLNVAFWNLHERKISWENGQWLVNEEYPLGFMHFSSFDINNKDVVAKKQTRYNSNSRSDFLEVSNVYREYLKKGSEIVSVASVDYGYEKFDDGRNISPALRRFVAVSEDEKIKGCINPFSSKSEVYFFAKKYKLFGKNVSSNVHVLFNEQGKFKFYERMISIIFRFTLIVLGPERYFEFMRYLAYYSSLLNQKNMFNK